MFSRRRAMKAGAGTCSFSPSSRPRPRTSAITSGCSACSMARVLLQMAGELAHVLEEAGRQRRRRARHCPPPWPADCRHRSSRACPPSCPWPRARSRDMRRAGSRRRCPLPTAMISGVNPELLIGEEPAGAPMPVCTSSSTSRSPRASQNSRSRFRNPARRNANADLALDRLDQDARGLRTGRTLHRVEIAERHLIEAVDLRAEAFEIFRRAARGDRRRACGRGRRLRR